MYVDVIFSWRQSAFNLERSPKQSVIPYLIWKALSKWLLKLINSTFQANDKFSWLIQLISQAVSWKLVNLNHNKKLQKLYLFGRGVDILQLLLTKAFKIMRL